jgi:acetolactate synthase-1/2/3 large subunit
VRRSATLIAANRSAKDARLNRRPNIGLIGDAGLALEALAQRVGDRARRTDWIAQLRARDNARDREIDEQAARIGEHVNPIAFFRTLDRVAADNAVIVADGGDFVATASYIVRPRGPLAWLDPGAFGTLGVGAGFALGAKLARPQDEVWLIWGDGASGYGLVEFDTFVRHGVPVVAIVGNDASWAQIAREQVKMLHDDVATVLARSDYHAVVQGFGAAGLVIRSAAEIEPTLRQARTLAASGQPVLVNVWLDRTEFREGSISM